MRRADRLFQIVQKLRRRRVTTAAQLAAALGVSERTIYRDVVDLSATGALVGPADPALTGERILVSFRIPRSTVWVDAEATVTRVIHGRRPGEFSRSLAIEFDDLEALPRFMLQEALRVVPPAPPKSAPGRRSSQSLVRGML